jgi:hypothetical protein
MRHVFSEQLVDALDRVEASPALLRLKMIELRNTLEECKEVEVRTEGKLILNALRRKIMHQPNFSLADIAAKLKTYDETRGDPDEADADADRDLLNRLLKGRTPGD